MPGLTIGRSYCDINRRSRRSRLGRIASVSFGESPVILLTVRRAYRDYIATSIQLDVRFRRSSLAWSLPWLIERISCQKRVYTSVRIMKEGVAWSL